MEIDNSSSTLPNDGINYQDLMYIDYYLNIIVMRCLPFAFLLFVPFSIYASFCTFNFWLKECLDSARRSESTQIYLAISCTNLLGLFVSDIPIFFRGNLNNICHLI